MSDKFDPLKAWLGVSSSDKPSYYDLIGLANFESEPPIIAEAADSAIAKVSEHLGGPHQAVAEKLVRDLKSLKAVLLSADKRRAYDEQLGKKLGVAVSSKSSMALNGPLPRAVDAADSPTMMLPPGALSGMRSLDDVLNSAPPSAAGFGGQPGFPPGALPPGAMPPGTMPPGAMPPGAMPPGAGLPGAMPGPGYGAPQYGAQPAPYGAPMGHAPNPYQQPPFGADPNAGYNPNAGFANQGFPNQGYPNPGFGAPTGPQAMFPGQMNPGPMGVPGMAPGPMGAGPGFDPHGASNPFGAPASSGVNLGLGGPSSLPGNAPSFGSGPNFGGGPASATLPRPSTKPKPRPVAAKAQGSNMTVALMVLGAAVVVLTVVIVIVQKKGDSGPPPLVASKPKDNVNKPIPVAPSPAVAKPLLSQTLPPAPVLGPTVKDQPITIDISQERNMRGRPGNDVDPRVTNTDTLVPMLTGAKPAGTSPTPSGTAAMPSATAKPATPAAMPAESTTGLKGVVVPQVAMEAGLPEDAARAKTVPTMLKGSRGSMKARDYAKAEETTLSALVTADTPALVKKAQEHARALELLQSFWTSVRDGIKSLKAGDELPVGGKVATVVKGEAGSLVVKMDGKDIAMVIDKLPPALAALLAEKAIGNEKPEAKLVIGTFLAVDQGADAARGFTLIEDAAGGEIVVDDLIDILKSTD